MYHVCRTQLCCALALSVCLSVCRVFFAVIVVVVIHYQCRSATHIRFVVDTVVVDVVVTVPAAYSMDVTTLGAADNVVLPANTATDQIRSSSSQLDLMTMDNQWTTAGLLL